MSTCPPRPSTGCRDPESASRDCGRSPASAGRPLLATALKPMGLRPSQLAELCGTFARAGLDMVKDDHGLADHAFCPFEARVEACLRAVEARPDGVRPQPDRLARGVARQLEFARRAGVAAVMLSPMVPGLPALAELAGLADGLPIVAHPAFGGVLRALEPALFGKLFRWYGADAVIYPHAGGRFGYSLAACAALAAALRRPHPRVRPAFPRRRAASRWNGWTSWSQFYGLTACCSSAGACTRRATHSPSAAAALVDRLARVASAERVR